MEKGQAASNITLGLAINAAINFSRDFLLAIRCGVCDFRGVAIRIFYGSPATTIENLVDFAKSGIDGLIMCGFRHRLSVDFVNSSPDIPPVVLGLFTPLEEGQIRYPDKVKTLVFDNERIGRIAADFFLDRGMLSFAFLGCDVFREKEACEIRFDSFRRRIAQRSVLPCTVSHLICGRTTSNEDFWLKDHVQAVEWLKSLRLPCGLYVNGEIEAFAALKLCQSLGIDVPGQIEILCLDGSFGFCEAASPTLSCIRVDFRSIANIAVGMALSMTGAPGRMDGCEDCVKLKLEIRERGSTASGRGYGLVVERVKEYVRTHACEGIGVPDIVKHVGVSRRIMEKRIREATGDSLLQMIRSVRLAEVCRLLKETDLSISEIMARSGYQINSNLCVLFKRTHGMTMRQYRNFARAADSGDASRR